MRAHLTTRRAARSGVFALTLTAALTGLSAPVQAAETATAKVIPNFGLEYRGTAGNSHVNVTLTGDRFTVDDIVPITAGSGCAPVAGDATKVTCVALKDPIGKFRSFRVFGGSGRDTIVNQTTVGTVPGAPMVAHGDDGLDALFGANLVNDELLGGNDGDVLRGQSGDDKLFGGRGDDALQGGDGTDRLYGSDGRDNLDGGLGNDRLEGGLGADRLDGGLGDPSWARDSVIYLERTARVVVDLRAPVATGQGEQGENDTITNVENIFSGEGDDYLTGNAGPNMIFGGRGSDLITGMEGLDTLEGQQGSDVLVPSQSQGWTVLPDGKKDILECGDDVPQDQDTAWRVVADGDFVNDCENVFPS